MKVFALDSVLWELLDVGVVKIWIIVLSHHTLDQFQIWLIL